MTKILFESIAINWDSKINPLTQKGVFRYDENMRTQCILWEMSRDLRKKEMGIR